MLLALLVEAASATSMASAVQGSIAAPLELDATWVITRLEERDRAHGTKGNGTPCDYDLGFSGGGASYTTETIYSISLASIDEDAGTAAYTRNETRTCTPGTASCPTGSTCSPSFAFTATKQ